MAYRIAVIAGDGIGREVMPEGLRAMEAAGKRFGIGFSWLELDWSCELYASTGAMMPGDWRDTLAACDAIYLGAVGHPGVPDHVSLWGLLIPIRRAFNQYANVRPVRLFEGITPPVRDRSPGDIDMIIVRENVEGEYSEIGGRLYADTDRELVTQQTVFTRVGVDRVMRYAFDLARARPRKRVTSATKSNGIIHTMPFWDERYRAVAALRLGAPASGPAARFEVAADRSALAVLHVPAAHLRDDGRWSLAAITFEVAEAVRNVEFRVQATAGVDLLVDYVDLTPVLPRLEPLQPAVVTELPPPPA